MSYELHLLILDFFLYIIADRVTLTFTHMDLEASDNCNKDSVQVLDGIDDQAPLVGKFCGSTSPSAITSQGMSLYVQFVSDAVGQESGFRATYTKATSGLQQSSY